MNTPIKISLLAVAVAGIAYLSFYSADVLRAPDSGFGLNPQACYENYCFNVELAETPEEHSLGLMRRQSLDKNKGMLFVFEKEEVYPFWMKNTLIPLDIVWLDNDGRIVHISRNSRPCGQSDCPIINPEVKAKYVLEINAGLSDEIGLTGGSGIKLNIYTDK